jgi:hypothetical protein
VKQDAIPDDSRTAQLAGILEALKRQHSERVNELNALMQRQAQLQRALTPEKMLMNLQQLAQQVEESSEIVAQRFLDQQIELKQFGSEFYEQRRMFHLRSAKKETLLRSLNRR